MKLELKWSPLIPLRDGTKHNLIYTIDELDNLPRTPAIYVFGRKRGGNTFVPIYIGQARRLRRRIRQQLNNAKLMLGLKAAPGRRRYLAVGHFTGKPGQELGRALTVLERALVEYALAEGHEILNIAGTKRREHVIASGGRKESRAWMPRQMLVEKRKLR